jgi:uncharacterized membrane protein required for colicin V production
MFAGAAAIGSIQGALRQVLGFGAFAVSFLLAANLRESVGGWFAQYWTTVPEQFSQMFGFGFAFAAIFILCLVLITVFYRRSRIFAGLRYADELVGAALALVLAIVVVSSVAFILDGYYQMTGIPATTGDVQWLRSLHAALDDSAIVGELRGTVIPALVGILGPLLPEAVRGLAL